MSNVKNPLIVLLLALGVISFLTGDLRPTVVIFVMVLLGVVLRFFQENTLSVNQKISLGGLNYDQ